jgi:hypothetical protein
MNPGFVNDSPSSHLIISAGAIADHSGLRGILTEHSIDLTYVGTAQKLVAANDAIDPGRLNGIWSENVYTIKHGVQVPHDVGLGMSAKAIQAVPFDEGTAGNIAMLVKNDDVCKILGDPGGKLGSSTTSAGSVEDSPSLVLGSVFGPAHGWASGARSIAASCAVGETVGPIVG